jgi:hypothetical protein
MALYGISGVTVSRETCSLGERRVPKIEPSTISLPTMRHLTQCVETKT